jgi:hypothetical protein
MKVGDLVKQVGWDSSVDRGGAYGVVTQVNRDRDIVFVHYRDRAHWIMSSLVEIVSASR